MAGEPAERDMLVLGLDTSTDQLGIALCGRRGSTGDCLGELILAQGLKHCERLVPGVDGLLRELDYRAADLDGIAVAVGPGSFTGLRIGVAAAQGLAMALDLPVAAVSTLHAVARQRLPWRGTVAPVLDARRGEVYFCAFLAHGATMSRCLDEQVAAPEAAAERLARLEAPVTLIGNGASAVVKSIAQLIGRTSIVDSFWALPRPRDVALLGADVLARGGGLTARDIEPVYLRRPDAEIKRSVATPD